jgi:hypothetical protein
MLKPLTLFLQGLRISTFSCQPCAKANFLQFSRYWRRRWCSDSFSSSTVFLCRFRIAGDRERRAAPSSTCRPWIKGYFLDLSPYRRRRRRSISPCCFDILRRRASQTERNRLGHSSGSRPVWARSRRSCQPFCPRNPPGLGRLAGGSFCSRRLRFGRRAAPLAAFRRATHLPTFAMTVIHQGDHPNDRSRRRPLVPSSPQSPF